MFKAHRVTVFVGMWLFAENRLGRPLVNVEDFAEFWELSAPSGYRKQQLFREVFPEFRTPRHLCDSLVEPPVIAAGADLDEVVTAVGLTPWAVAS